MALVRSLRFPRRPRFLDRSLVIGETKVEVWSELHLLVISVEVVAFVTRIITARMLARDDGALEIMSVADCVPKKWITRTCRRNLTQRSHAVPTEVLKSAAASR